MTLIEGLIAETIVSGSITIALRKADERGRVRNSLMEWEIEGLPTPVLDSVLERHAGTPESRKETFISTAIIGTTREFVNRKMFDYVVQGCVNKNSKLRERFTFIEKLFKKGDR